MIISKQSNRPGEREVELLNKMRGAMSTAAKYVPADLGAGNFNASKLANVGKSMSELADKAAADMQDSRDAAFNADQENSAAEAADLSSSADGLDSNTRDNDDDSAGLLKILRMIFKIVPIGTNMIKKTKTLAQGFAESSVGLITLIKNLAITTIILGVDTFIFVGELAYYMFKMAICSVGSALNLHKCILFYIVDVIMFVFLLIITSVLFMVDMFLGIKSMVGISCVECLIFGLDLIEKLDEFLHSITEVHPFHYPQFVTNLCYRCSSGGKDSGFSEASNKIFKDIFVMIPNNIGSPIGNIVRGIGHIFGFFIA